MDIAKDGNTNYDVDIVIGDKPEDGTSSPILFTITGKKGLGSKHVVTEKGFKSSTRNHITVASNDVGPVTGFIIDLENNGKLSPVLVKIKNNSTLLN